MSAVGDKAHCVRDRSALRTMALRRFVSERFALWVTVPIAALLYAAPASLGHAEAVEAARGALATFLALLCLRIADDLADLERDRVLHPGRGLVSGRIDPGGLRDANLVLAAALVVLESSSTWRLALCVGGIGFYRLWYTTWRGRVHSLARPFLSNLAFPVAVLHGAGPAGWRSAIPLAVYAWLSAVGHEFGHNVRSPEDESPLGPGYAHALGARGTATFSIGLFAAALLAAVQLWLGLDRPSPLGVALLAAVTGLGFCMLRLLLEPGPRRSRTLYRAGILFGLMPPMGLLLR